MAEDVIDTTTAQGRFILQIMAAIAELESSIIGDRVAAGMARAKAEGKHIGRKLLDVSVISICDALWNSPTVRAAAERLHCSRSYIYAELAKFGTTPRDVIEGRWKPPARPLKSQPARLKTGQKSG
ncbi:hypothetical protein ES703_120962 [subsurface metagenome]